uniref:Daxx histone-binding domain-containing protein n=1 Tax=Anopheles dirus TaxID=7168 RepID=A0A182NZB1_9DIPT
MEASSVIVLDSDSDDGIVMENPPNCTERKRKATSPLLHTPPPQTNGATQDASSGGSGSASASGAGSGAQDPQRKRIKPITIATNLSDKRWCSDGGTPPHNNNNNNNQAMIVNENFAPITYSEDWEQEIKQYQRTLAGGGALTVQATPPTPASSRSSTTNEDPDASSRSTPPDTEKLPQDTHTQSRKAPSTTSRRKQVGGGGAIEKNPIGKEFQELLDACRKADSSKDMETLIEKKLVRYYEIVHPDYVSSRSFKKAVVKVTAEVHAHPNLVFLKLANIVEELNARRKSHPSIAQSTAIASAVAAPAEVPGSDNRTSSVRADAGADEATVEGIKSTGNAKKDLQITKLNRVLYMLTKRIQQLEEAEVDFSHENNSAFLLTERYKKRAYEVYEKLCDITGESKNAHRLVRKPIHFQGTQYTEFNRTLSQFVNKTNTFPNFRDVLKCLQHCNVKHDYGLRSERMNRIAQDAFIKVGKQLQRRRKTDLYEMVVYHTGEEKDPATIDPKLREKLEENGKHYSKVNSIIDKYAEKELTSREEDPEKRHNSKDNQNSETMPSSSSGSVPSATVTSATSAKEATANGGTDEVVLQVTDDDDDEEDDEDDDDDDDEDDEDEFESTTKENVRPDSFEDVVISDDDELVVLDS